MIYLHINKSYFFIFPLIVLVSCDYQSSQNKISKDGRGYLNEVRETYGSDKVFHSTISFNINKDLFYTVTRDNHISKYTMSREAKGNTYYTTYDNGFIQYYINDSLQDDKTYSKTFFNVKLDGFVYTSSIPHILNGTDILVDSLPSVMIRNTLYNVLYIHTKPIPDIIVDKFYLYINPENKYIEYIAQEYHLTHPKPIFKRYYNHRIINGILFSDYYRFMPVNPETPLDSLYILFNNVQLEEIEGTKYNNIEVRLTEQKPHEIIP